MEKENEQKADEEAQSESSTETENAGVQSEADEKVKQLNADTERINKAIAENENAKARQKLGGVTEAGQAPEKPKKMSDTEYADALERGEVNPLKDDKLI